MKPNINRYFSRRWLGVGMSLVAAAAAYASTDVTFQVDMSTEANTPVTAVTIAGVMNSWSYQNPSWALVQSNTSTIWTNTFTITDPVGTVEYCKFNDNTTGWEPLANNRGFVLSATSPQVLPPTEWNVNDWPTPTNEVTFQVNMTAQVFTKAFTNGDPNGSITVSGDFEGWNAGLALTNNPTTGDNSSNFYTGTFWSVGFPGQTINYKFRMNGGWEQPASTSGNNRQSTLGNANVVDPTGNKLYGPNVLPLVYYNDAGINDVCLTPINVTFTVLVTNGTPDAANPTYNFIKGTDTLWVNGDFLNWWTWNTGLGGSAPVNTQMKEVGSSDLYTNTLTIPAGNPLNITYKYSMDEYDDENGYATNHIRYIRNLGPSFSLPQDDWSWNVQQPNVGLPFPGTGPYPGATPGANTWPTQPKAIIEQNFGLLANGKPSGGNLPITWLGRQGVFLESRASLSSGSWSTLMGTTATQSTNLPITGTSQFIRLEYLQ